MARSDYWIERALVRITGVDMPRIKKLIREAYARPQQRQPPIGLQVQQAVAQSDPTGRARLAEFLREQYGDFADNVIPYLGVPQEDIEEPVEGEVI